MARKEKPAAQGPKKKGSKLLTFFSVLLILVGVAVVAYPFLLTQVSEQQKDAVVAQLERELPIHRDEADFEAVDDDFIASMPVVDAPKYTAEEIRSAGNALSLAESMLDDDTLSAVGGLFGLGGSATEAPGLRYTAAPRATPIPPPPTEAPRATDEAEYGVIVHTPEPTAGQPGQTPQPVEPPVTTEQPAELAQAQPAAQPELPQPSVGNAPSQRVQQQPEQPPIGQAEPPVPTQPDIAVEQPMITEQPAPPAQAPQGQPPVTEAPTVPQATDDPHSITGVQRAQPLLRDAAPVAYEDFANIEAGGDTLRNTFADTYDTYRDRRTTKVEVPIKLTLDSIRTQFDATLTLITLFQSLPSVANTEATLESAAGERTVGLMEGSVLLVRDMQALNEALDGLERITPFAAEEAQATVSRGLDEIVLLGDQALNMLDFLAAHMTQDDITRYMQLRSSSMVGETEAVYLLELPSIGLKVGCFPDLTFEQMYKSMRKGAALFPRVGAPNTNTNITIAAHRTGSAAFFNKFDQVKTGDTILLHTRTLGSFRYMVENVAVVESDDWTTTYTIGYPALTLLSCQEYEGVSHGRRILVRGRLVGIAR